MLDFPMNPTFDEPEEHVGCAATSVPFDCLDGLSMFKKWSAEKRQWCCSARGLALAGSRHGCRLHQTKTRWFNGVCSLPA
eukprot:s5572_g2.t1